MKDKLEEHTCPKCGQTFTERPAVLCPLQAVAGISRETKILRCHKYLHDGCEKCIQLWLNEDVSTDFSNKCNN